MLGQVPPQQADEANDDLADDDRNDADAWLNGVMSGNYQDDARNFADNDNPNDEQRRLDRGHSAWVTPHNRPFSGYGHGFGGRGVGFRAHPYNHGWRGGYHIRSGLTLANAVGGAWNAADGTGGISGRKVPRPLVALNQTQYYFPDDPLLQANRLGYSQQPMWNDLVSSNNSYPAMFNEKFAQAMGTIARIPDSGIPARVTSDHLDDTFKTEVSQALAIKLDLKTRQHANKKMLQKLIKSGGSCSSLKQALQARAAVYDEVADPA